MIGWTAPRTDPIGPGCSSPAWPVIIECFLGSHMETLLFFSGEEKWNMSEIPFAYYYLSIIIVFYPIWKIHNRVGLPPKYSLWLFLPTIGILLVLFNIANSKWSHENKIQKWYIMNLSSYIMLSTLLIIGVLISFLYVFLVMKILKKAGFSRWLTVISVVPLLNILAIWIFAFIKWPVEKTTCQ